MSYAVDSKSFFRLANKYPVDIRSTECTVEEKISPRINVKR